MKKKKKGKFEKNLKAYSAVAASTLLLAPSANAAVQYFNPPDINVNSGNTPVFVDLDNNLTDDFIFRYYGTVETHALGINGTNNPSNSVINSDLSPASDAPVHTQGHFNSLTISSILAAKLFSGYTVQSTLTTIHAWRPFGQPARYATQGPYSGIIGNFNGETGFLGVRFNTACGLAFGWIRYSANSNATIGTIHDWAYEDNCGTAIIAGNIGAPAVPAPTLNEWGLIVLITLLAGAGVSVLRKQEKA